MEGCFWNIIQTLKIKPVFQMTFVYMNKVLFSWVKASPFYLFQSVLQRTFNLKKCNTIFRTVQIALKSSLNSNVYIHQSTCSVLFNTQWYNIFFFFFPSHSTKRNMAWKKLDLAVLILEKIYEKLETKAVARRCFVKKVFLTISQNSHENTCVGVSFLNKVVCQHRFFTLNFAKLLNFLIFKISKLFYRTPPVAASVENLGSTSFVSMFSLFQCFPIFCSNLCSPWNIIVFWWIPGK